jgi:ubiquinone/menaquinone biosynthesis C-methylase UbiE
MVDQSSIQIGTHGEKYGNWMSNPFLVMIGGIAAVLAILMILFFAVWHLKVLGILFAVLTAVMTGLLIWFLKLRQEYAYGGGGIMDQVHQKLVPYLDFDGEGTILEVGCGSGPLVVRCALTWTQANVIGLDYWGVSFDYNKELCEKNAAMEGVGERCTFIQGDARKLDLPDESVDAVISNYVYHNILGSDQQELLLESLRVLKKGGVFALHDDMKPRLYGDMEAFAQKLRDMGYEEVELVDTRETIFGSEAKANAVMLGGSRLLKGRK